MATVERGHTKKVTCLVKDENENLVDPDSSALYIAIESTQTGDSYVAKTAMTRSTTGTFTYYVTTADTDDLGDYQVEYSGSYNTRAILDNEILQIVERE